MQFVIPEMDNIAYLRRLTKSAIERHETVLLCIAQDQGGNNRIKLFENEAKGKHTEEQFYTYFLEDEAFNKQLKAANNIQLYITNTPCSEREHLCAEKLRTFATEVVPSKVTIKCMHHYYLDDPANVAGLVLLANEDNVTLGMIQEANWNELRLQLGVNDADFDRMMNHPPNLNNQFEEAFGSLCVDGSNRRARRQQKLLTIMRQKKVDSNCNRVCR